MSSSSNRLWPLLLFPMQEDSTFTCLIPFKKRLFGFTPYLLLLLWGHGLASRKRVISITFFFERGYHAFLAGGLGDPEKTIRNYPTSWRHRVIPSLYDFLLVFIPILPLITALQFCGHWETTALYPEEQQYSRDAWEYTALRDTWVLVL